MKKTYLQPNTKIFYIKPCAICAGSFGDSNGTNTITGGGNLGNASSGTNQLSRDNDSMWDDDDNE